MRIGVALLALPLALGCDKDPAPTPSSGAAAPAALSTTTPAPSPPAVPDPPRAPDIVVDTANVSIGNDRVATGEPGLADKVGVFVKDRPMIEGQAVSLVAMRGARPSAVAAVVTALRRAKAASAVVRTEARDGTTQKVPLSLTTTGPDCAVVAWIAKDAAIDVWPSGGGTARRIIKGLAGPDMTLGTDAVLKAQASCAAPVLYVGAEDSFVWGLVFDLATASMSAPGARATTAVLVTGAVPGRKLLWPE